MTPPAPSPDLPPLWEDLAHLSPLGDQRAHRLAAWLAEGLDAGRGGGTVLDVGCGWATLLIDTVAASRTGAGVGVDLDAARIAEGRRRAHARGLEGRVRLLAEDAASAAPGTHDALVAVGASQVWGADVSEGGALDYASALTAMRATLPRGGRLLYGEAIWSRPPTPEATSPLSGRDDEFLLLPDLLDLVADHGFAAVGVAESTQEEWDDFEAGFVARHARWLAAHPGDHADAAGVREAAQRQRDAYLRGYRGVLGFAWLRLLAV